MDIPWLLTRESSTEIDTAPPWVRHSRLQIQQELCAKRFLRFASLHQVHGAFFIWSAALFFAGVNPLLCLAPLAYFTGIVSLTHRRLASIDLEQLSAFILLLNMLNATHLASLCILQGERILASPLFACVPLTRVFFGIFTQEVHCHLGLSTLLAVLAISCNSKRVAGGEALLVIVALLLLELVVVSGLAEGPCGYEEAVMHLAQCRAQHQLARSQAVQRIDVEREEFSGRLLAVATQGIAELTAAVQRASEPVLDMLKSSCATGTKSAQEADRIGRIGEALKEEVADLLRHKTQVTWSRLQEHAQERAKQLRLYDECQQASSESFLGYVQQNLGRSLAQMQELEMEAEASLEQLVQGEVKRARETADARMELVRQSAQAMERRVSDTVEVLLFLLKYFRSKGAPNVVVVTSPSQTRSPSSSSLRQRRGDSEGSRRSTHGGISSSRILPAIRERSLLGDHGKEEHENVQILRKEAVEESRDGSARNESGATNSDDSKDLQSNSAKANSASSSSSSIVDPTLTASVFGSSSDGSRATGPTLANDSPRSTRNSEIITDLEGVSEDGSSTRTSSGLQGEASHDGQESPIGYTGMTSGDVRRTLERHPLFASRLCYQSDNFFWSWASSRDFRAEADALRQWQRAATSSRANTTPTATHLPPSPFSFQSSMQISRTSSVASSTENASGQQSLQSSQPLPSSVYIDLSEVPLAVLQQCNNDDGTSYGLWMGENGSTDSDSVGSWADY